MSYSGNIYIYLQYFPLTTLIKLNQQMRQLLNTCPETVSWQYIRRCFKGHSFSTYHTNCFLFWLAVIELSPKLCSSKRLLYCISKRVYMCSSSLSFFFSLLKLCETMGQAKFKDSLKCH